jgi:hypothetical protein
MKSEEIDSTLSPGTYYFSGNNKLDPAELIGGRPWRIIL